MGASRGTTEAFFLSLFNAFRMSAGASFDKLKKKMRSSNHKKAFH
jgi:hypothetical protein